MNSFRSWRDIDWNNLWKIQMNLHSTSLEAIDHYSPWEKQEVTQQYTNLALRCNWIRGLENELKNIPLSTNSTILDIGTGPGTHIISLAPQVHQITAIEPAHTMMNILKKNIEKQNIKNIHCIQKKWEDISLNELKQSYDLVLASFSLFMQDIRPAIEKMIAASSTYIMLVWHVGCPCWEQMYSDIWFDLHRSNYYPIPKVEDLLHVLYQMNIFPNITPYTINEYYKFTSWNEALNYFFDELHITNPQQKKRLTTYLTQHTQKRNGNIILNGPSSYAVLWWRKENK